MLQRAVLKFEGKDYKSELTNATVSGAWRGQKSKMRSKDFNCEELKSFVDQHIEEAHECVKLTDRDQFEFLHREQIRFGHLIRFRLGFDC